MNPFSTKTIALAAVIALGSLMSSSAHAGILHTANGDAVMTMDGAAVLVDDFDECDAGPVNQYAEDGVVLFDFNKSVLTKKYKNNLQRLAARLRANNEKVSVIGFADRIGNAAYNEKLALNRAKSVRDFLVAKGVKANRIEVRSLGDSMSKTNCEADLTRAEIISCLSGDRRVEIKIK
jgi:outer membrane protein OmpA-like peptidoglycan-associated protein